MILKLFYNNKSLVIETECKKSIFDTLRIYYKSTEDSPELVSNDPNEILKALYNKPDDWIEVYTNPALSITGSKSNFYIRPKEDWYKPKYLAFMDKVSKLIGANIECNNNVFSTKANIQIINNTIYVANKN